MAKVIDPQNVITPGVSIAPAVLVTTTATGVAVDLTDVDQALVLFNYGVITDGTFTPSITSSATLGGSYTADTDVSGTLTAGTSAADELIVAVAYNGSKNFIKAVVTVSGSPSTGGYVSATVIPFKNGYRP
jgi:hypothetical protein